MRRSLSSRTVTHASAPTSTTTVYVHDLSDRIIAELDASGQTQREYIWLDDMPVAVVDNVQSGSPVIYHVHVDHLMRPARMTAADGSWVWDVIYAPFGGVSYIWSNPANIDLRFPGQWFQLESGLAYNWHRHYDATLGRYVQADPIGLAGGRSLYGYVGGSPQSYVDPNGLNPVIAVPIVAGAVGALAALIAPSVRPMIKELYDAARNELNDEGKTYQTYTRYHPVFGCYTGRTSGNGTPEANIYARSLTHGTLNVLGSEPPVLDRSSPSYTAIRGREQLMIDANGGAQAWGGTSANIINGISAGNPYGTIFIGEAVRSWGKPQIGDKCTCGN